MEPMHQGTNHQVSSHIPQSSTYSYSREQSRRGPEFERTEREHFRVDVHLQHPQPHPYLFCPTRSLNMHEAIQIEIEKERIREEIIMSEIVRRRIEFEVRRDLMVMDRELDLQRSSNGFPFGSSPVMGFDLPHLVTTAKGRSLEERIVLSGSLKDGEIETSLFLRGTCDLRISEVEPVPVKEEGKGKEKIILLAKPDKNISGSKRKAVTSPSPRGDVNEFPSDAILKMKAKVEWSCGLCQVHVSSERVLNEHLRGKKHRAKEAALTADRAGKNCSTGLLPKKTTESIQVAGAVDPGKDASSKSDDLQDNLNSDNLKKHDSVEVEKVEKKGDLNKKKYEFWCEMCQAAAPSEKVMNAHKNGKKHFRRLQKRNRNGGCPSDQKSIKPEDNDFVNETKPDDEMTKPNVGDEHKDDKMTVF